MNIEYLVMGIISLLIGIYLIYALVRAEKF
jgi:K+-transporting ATPase KdpF subunit